MNHLLPTTYYYLCQIYYIYYFSRTSYYSLFAKYEWLTIMINIIITLITSVTTTTTTTSITYPPTYLPTYLPTYYDYGYYYYLPLLPRPTTAYNCLLLLITTY